MDAGLNRTQELLAFISESPTPYHAVAAVERRLLAEGFVRLHEAEHWEPAAGQGYFVVRGGTSLLAFRVQRPDFTNFQTVLCHSDSPCLRIKENGQMTALKRYARMNVEKYGGLLMAPWLDRPLSAAGRVILETESGLEERLVDFDRDLMLIPNVAIHMDRKANEGKKYEVQKDLLPLYGQDLSGDTFMVQLAGLAGCRPEQILSSDLVIYNRMKGRIWGAEREFFSAPRIDDLQCAFGGLCAFLGGSHPDTAAVFAVLDHEEVGSRSRQGADSTFLRDCLGRINGAFGRDGEQYLRAVAEGFQISADNAQAVAPSHPEKYDPVNQVFMNDGVVIKYHGEQKYTTDGLSAAVVKRLAARAGVPVQVYTNHSDVGGGSTLGNLSNSQVSFLSADIGLAQLAMHSPYETAGVRDTEYLVKLLEEYYRSCICRDRGRLYWK
ncbi:MAG TPA: M18 family aminopeptidase [Lachnospiraceae bacterium]|nr:M18 family aminopeptidase [Lachnospiraceae bacterium]